MTVHPVGIALAFLVFWSLAASGAFLCAVCLRRLARWHGLAGGGRVALAEGVGAVLHLVGLAAGASLVVAGLYATYVVLLAR